MALEHLQGTTYGPFDLQISGAKVAEYVAATGDAPDRWESVAPPSFAGALLFVVAPSFLHSEAVSGHTRSLVHADQTFTWHQPLRIGSDVVVTAAVERVRARGGVDFVTFDASVTGEGGTWLDSRSTFLLGSEPAVDPVPERTEPAVGDAGRRDDSPQPDEDGWVMHRSASRLDLVRYAAASGDFNPIHFDHATGVAAGFGGTIVHGLLMAAWLTQLAVAQTGGEQPLATARFRFRKALYPGVQAVGTARRGAAEGGPVPVDLRLSADGDLVTARAGLRGE